MKSVTAWMPNWKKNGWQTANKKPVLNRDLLEHIDSLLVAFRQDRRFVYIATPCHRHHRAITAISWPLCRSIEFRYVAAHSGIEGNEEADRLAKLGASKTSSM